MTDTLNIKIILGSTRPNRFSEYPGTWIFELLQKKEGVQAEIIDLREYPIPFFNEAVTPSSKKEPYTHEAVVRWTSKIKEADGFIVITPEYNRGPSAVLKNAFDYAYQEWNKKPIGFVSYGTVGGARSMSDLQLAAIELQMVPIRNSVYIQSPWTLRDTKGALNEGALDSYTKSAEGVIEQLLWWVRILKDARV
ncbi:NADPH-dependent oxidoreductase [Candidatus Parcubacteria bacterium]|nr:MAG: NADPH-dependent oxidoreductase [Candidatus Parcubacteria bacterium]